MIAASFSARLVAEQGDESAAFRRGAIKGSSIIVSMGLFFLIGQLRAFSASETDQRQFFVEIVNYLHAVEYSVTAPPGVPTLVATHLRADGAEDPLGKIQRNISATQNARRQAVALIKGPLGQSIKWVNFSPDNQLLLAGFEDPSTGVMTSATVFRSSDLAAVLRVTSVGEIRDSLWSPDSKRLTILESTERISKSPWGLIAAVSGHPVELQNFFLRLLDIDSHRDELVKVATNIENALAELRAQPSAY